MFWCNSKWHGNVEFTYRGKRLLLHYYKRGAGKKAPIIILHGLGGSHLGWELLVLPHLQISDRPIYALDFPGFGHSGFIDGVNFSDLVEVVKLFLKKKRIRKAILVGHSMGAAIALLFAERYPDKVSAVVSAGSPTHLIDYFGNLRLSTKMLKRIVGICPEIAHFYKDWLLFLKIPTIAAWILELGDMKAISSDLSNLREYILEYDFRHSDPRTYINLLNCFSHFDFRENIRGIDSSIPVLIVDGENVRFPVVDTTLRLAHLINHAKTHKIKGAGHLAPLSHPEEFSRAVEVFVQEIS